jgi:hypothetical protein
VSFGAGPNRPAGSGGVSCWTGPRGQRAYAVGTERSTRYGDRGAGGVDDRASATGLPHRPVLGSRCAAPRPADPSRCPARVLPGGSLQEPGPDDSVHGRDWRSLGHEKPSTDIALDGDPRCGWKCWRRASPRLGRGALGACRDGQARDAISAPAAPAAPGRGVIADRPTRRRHACCPVLCSAPHAAGCSGCRSTGRRHGRGRAAVVLRADAAESTRDRVLARAVDAAPRMVATRRSRRAVGGPGPGPRRCLRAGG